MRVLIADDDPIILLDLKQMLENLGFAVVAEAEDGQAAVELAKSSKPDVCVLDVKMPNMDGIEVAGTAHRMDGVPVPLRAPRETDRPSIEDVLAAVAS